MAVTLTTLRARAREHADMVGSAFVTDTATSLDAFINEGLGKLYDLLVQVYGEDYFLSSNVFNTVAGTSAYALPADFAKLRGIDVTIGGEPVALEKFNFAERNAYRASINNGLVPSYRLEGNNVRLYPVPTAVYALTLWYVPRSALLVAPGDSVDYPNGWEEYAVLYAAAKCLAKEESDTSAVLALLAACEARIESAAESRDAGEPEQVVDTDVPRRGIWPPWRFS